MCFNHHPFTVCHSRQDTFTCCLTHSSARMGKQSKRTSKKSNLGPGGVEAGKGSGPQEQQPANSTPSQQNGQAGERPVRVYADGECMLV